MTFRGRPVPAALMAAIAGVLVCSGLWAWATAGPNPSLRSALGLSDALPVPLPRGLSVVISPHTAAFSPRVGVTACGTSITFANDLDTAVDVRSASLSPGRFDVRLPAHTWAVVRLQQPGLYHYYDAQSARPLRVVAGSDVITGRAGALPVREGWVAVLCGLPGLQQHLGIPANQDLFSPKVLVAVAGSTVVVSNHDRGRDA